MDTSGIANVSSSAAPPASTAPWWAVWLVLLGCALLSTISFAKGFVYRISPDAYVYYLINYRDGLIRRGLLGEILSWFVDQGQLDSTIAVAAALYTAASVATSLLLFGWAAVVELRRRDLLISSLYAVCAASQFLPTIAYGSGFLDAYDYVLLILAAMAFANGRMWLGATIGFAGPFIHDAYFFIWLCLVILVVWQKRSVSTLLALGAPLIATAIVYWVPAPEAGIAQMRFAPLPEGMKEFAIAFQFAQTMASSLQIGLWKISNSSANVAAAIGFFTLPAVFVALIYGCHRAKVRDILVLALATALPLSINMFAWDLSRFLAPAGFFALLGVLYMDATRPAARARPWQVPTCWIAALVLVQVPFVYGYAEVAAVTDQTVLKAWPIGRAVTSGVSLYSRNMGPKVVPVPNGEDPPGNVWYMEEDAWRGALVRRPGTNMFDATMTRGGMVVTYVARIVQAGDTIFITRDPDDEKLKMTYVGTLKGNQVNGTYSGGIWKATIRR